MELKRGSMKTRPWLLVCGTPGSSTFRSWRSSTATPEFLAAEDTAEAPAGSAAAGATRFWFDPETSLVVDRLLPGAFLLIKPSPWPLALPPQARAKAARVGDPGFGPWVTPTATPEDLGSCGWAPPALKARRLASSSGVGLGGLGMGSRRLVSRFRVDCAG